MLFIFLLLLFLYLFLTKYYITEDVIVKDAIVTVQDEHGLIDTLELVQNDEAPLYWYYTSPTLRGELNTKYTLKIDWNGKKYSSNTSIPDTMALDSVWLDNFQSFESDTIKSLKVKFELILLSSTL